MAAGSKSLALVVVVFLAGGCPQRGAEAGSSVAVGQESGSVGASVAAGQESGSAGASVAAGQESGSAEASRLDCERQPFAGELAIAEASGAVYLPATGGHGARVVVAGDSGTGGAIMAVDAGTGKVAWRGKLPLDKGASDDIEGLAVRGDTIYAITSSGWMRHFSMAHEGELALTEPAYAIAESADLRCANPRSTNCAANYEGLCVRGGPIAPGACAGYAVAKEYGELVCLVLDGHGRLHADGDRRIEVAPGRVLSGCDFSPDTGTLWVGSNLFGMSRVYVVAEKSARVTAVAGLGRGFPEAIAIGPGGAVYRFSDTTSSPSLADRYLCTPAP